MADVARGDTTDSPRPAVGGRLRCSLLPIAVISASIAALAYVFLARTGALDTRRTEAGREYVEAVRGLHLLELVEEEYSFTLSRTIIRPWWERIPLPELDCELEIGAYYSVRVTAGIDMAGTRDDLVEIEGRRAVVTLPVPEIVNTVARETGSAWIRTGGMPRNWDEDLLAERSEMAVEACEEARGDALEAGIIERAESVATAQVSQALRSLGIEEAHVSFE